MKKTLFVILLSASAINVVNAQTLYVPSGTSGIGSSSTTHVGIGLSSPAYRFDVINSNTGQTSSARIANFSNAGATFNTTSGAMYSYGGYFSSTSTRSAGSNTLTNIGLYATASGGVDNIAAMLDLTNVGRITAATPGGNPGLMFYTGATFDQNRFDIFNAGTYFYIGPSGAVDGLSIKRSDRFVGIGTNSPSQKLEVNGAIKLGNTTVDNAGTIRWTGVDFQGYTGSAWKSLSSGEGWLRNGLTSYYTTGGVGIGVQTVHNPSYLSGFKMAVNGGLYCGDPVTTTNGYLQVYGSTSYGWNIVSRTTNTNTKAFLVQKVINTGNVHEDTSNLEETFVVYGDGRVYATEVTVATTPFPDYVFDKEYDMMSLADVEKHIQVHKRLPEMPSAADVAEKGLSLGEVNVLLVKKIEELTLHMIEMQKDIAELKKSINEKKN